MRPSRAVRAAMTAGGLVAALAVAHGSAWGAGPAPSTSAADLDAAAAYCTSSGGEVQERHAMWNTNGDASAWVALADSVDLCRFQADDEAQSRIYVDLVTLYSEQPSLAAAAYLAKVPPPASSGGANPASIYCTALGASSQYGQGATGGGFVAIDDPDDQVVAMCVFADGSMIDEWGLTYHSQDIIRGADLEPLLRSAAQPYPPIYPTGS